MEKELTATYAGTSMDYHFFRIDWGQGLTGNIYVPKDEPVPDTVTIRLRTKARPERRLGQRKIRANLFSLKTVVRRSLDPARQGQPTYGRNT